MSSPGTISPIIFEPARPTPEDARQVMDWRNDPVSLAAAFHHEPKVWERFLPEFLADYFVGEPGPQFARIGGQRIAFLRMLPVEHPPQPGRFVEIGINVAPDWRGRGLGVAILRALDGLLRNAGVDGVVAEVRAENAASLRTFRAAGYRELGPVVKLVEDTGERATIVRFAKDLAGSGAPEGGA